MAYSQERQYICVWAVAMLEYSTCPQEVNSIGYLSSRQALTIWSELLPHRPLSAMFAAQLFLYGIVIDHTQINCPQVITISLFTYIKSISNRVCTWKQLSQHVTFLPFNFTDFSFTWKLLLLIAWEQYIALQP